MSFDTNELDHHLGLLFHSTPLMMGFCEIEGSDIRHVRDNFSAARFFELNPEQTSGKLASELGVPSSVIQKWILHFNEAKVSGKPQNFEYVQEVLGKKHYLSTTLIFLGTSKTGEFQLSYTTHDLTALKEPELKIVSDQKLNLVLSMANLVMFERNLQTNRVYWSEDAKHILGLSTEEREGSFRYLIERSHPDDREDLEKKVKNLLEQGKSINATFRLFRPDNKMIWIQVRASSLNDEAGVPQHTVGIIKDITERHLGEEALKATEYLYRSLFENMTEEVHAWNLVYHQDGSIKTWRLLDANPSALKTWGRKLEDILGKTTDEIFGPGSTQHYLPVVQKIFQDKHPYSYQDYFPNLKKYFRFTSFALGDMFFTTGTDITQIKENEIRLRESEVINRTITDNAASCLFMMDNKGHPTFMNPAAKRVTGYQSLDEIKDKPLHCAIHWKKPDGSLYPLEECPIDNAQNNFIMIQNHEEVFSRKDGTLFPVSFSLAPLQKSDEIIGAVLEFRDITEEKKSKESLKEALNLRDEFISIASHELKTPLTSLKLQVQLQTRSIKLGKPGTCSQESIEIYNEKIEEYVNRLDRLINDTLDISRIRTGKLSLIKETVDLCVIAKEVVDRMQMTYKAADGDEIIFECSGKKLAKVDSMRIEQVLSNLLQNALKYAKGKGVKVSIFEESSIFQIIVSDKGMGVLPDIQSKIFDRFTRGISASEVSGLGLGLFISQQIIHAHKGRLWVDSVPGKGAAFHIEIPRLET